MGSRVLYNDFRFGIVDEKLRRRVDQEYYRYSASRIENLVPMRTGGLTLRDGSSSTEVLNADGSQFSLSGYKKIIPFVIGTSRTCIVALSPTLGVSVLSPSDDGSFSVLATDSTKIYTDAELKEIQYAQTYDRLIIVNHNHCPLVVGKDGNGVSISNLVLDDECERNEADGDYAAMHFPYNGILTTSGNYPSSVSFCANRLWFASSDNKPYGLWASRPFQYDNFQDYDYYEYTKESITTEAYLKALEGDSEISSVTNADGTRTVVVRIVSADGGYYQEHTRRYSTDGTYTDEATGDRVYYTVPTVEWRKITRDDSAMILELSSDRDERICWIAVSGDILIGTSSSEWVIPYNSTATTVSVQKLSAFGSARFIHSVYGGDGIFHVQTGNRSIRLINYSSRGIGFSDVTYQCPSLFSCGIKELVWQRVQEPRLYALLSDGSIAVMCYDPTYGVQAWSLWKSSTSKWSSISILDNDSGQSVYALREDGKLMEFVPGKKTDDSSTINGILISNNVDSESVVANYKKLNGIWLDTMQTHFKVGQLGGTLQAPRDYSSDLVMVLNYTRATNEGLRIEVDTIPNKEFTLLALVIDVEVS